MKLNPCRSWVLLRQRIGHLERQLSAARSEAERRQDVRGGQEALTYTLERCMNLQRDLDRCSPIQAVRGTILPRGTLKAHGMWW